VRMEVGVPRRVASRRQGHPSGLGRRVNGHISDSIGAISLLLQASQFKSIHNTHTLNLPRH